MKYVKILGLAAVAAAALMAFVGAGTASATTLTCGATVCPEGTLIQSTSEGHAVLDSSILGNVECNSTVEGTTTNAGGSTETVKGVIKEVVTSETTTDYGLTFSGCTSAVVKVLHAGKLEIHTEGSTANGNGTLTSNETEVTVEKAGFHCIFSTSNTDIGTVTGSSTTGATATFDISATIPRTGGRSGAFCGSSAPWTGSYKVTTPDSVNVD